MTNSNGFVVFIVAIGAFLALMAGIALVNPRANIPVVSPVVCSLKGYTWYDGDIFNAPGCYNYQGGE